MLAGALLLTGACARPAVHRSEALARSRALLDRIDALEADLHAQTSEVDFYTELNERRKTTTEFACNVSKTHVREIERLAEAQIKKRRERARARRLALSGPQLGSEKSHPLRRGLP